MLRTNLATRPFYNERAVHAVLAVVAVVAVAITVFNASRILTLSRRHAALSVQAGRDQERASKLRDEAARIRRGINSRDLEVLSAAAREANGIIDRRTFSWTELFNRFETTLPDDVMIASVRPRVEKDGLVALSMVIIGRRVEEIDAFIEKLEATGAFADLLWREEFVNQEGLLEATIEGRYRPGAGTTPGLENTTGDLTPRGSQQR